MKRILFVCTGNTCRSPMAEALLRKLAQERGVPIEVKSAGVSTMDGLPVSRHAAEVLRKRRIDHGGKSNALDPGAVEWADLVLTMTASHKRSLLQWFPEAVEKTYTLKEFVHLDESTLADIEKLEQLYTEMHMKQALGGQLTDEERSELLLLERKIPSFDIADPFGGPLEEYDRCAQEIEAALLKLLDRLEK
ncbi:low molecular weight protein arginine phosphatase [Paenibacillus protaetiae]|uniref:Low molecular weight protein arginine phosphatase n=1 Tax=Paenibacillus protaetiae TaxID=2509456 RepID=A0A4P6EYA6_9BACL|nr:low molecular weight protein arginine phosphatase [Paenibacillus protaetiae]QAY67695.1 low molecular weight protein arginine phosphatase [Paenibacillus protaetiae]